MLGLSVISIPCKIARKVFNLAASIFTLLAEVVHFKDDYFNNLKNHTLKVIDRALTLLCSPLNIVISRVRYLLGLIHPACVFTR